MQTFISSSSLQTIQIAADFAQTMNGGEVILLEGELGAGKTTFVQGFAKALGYDDPVRSPTFTLMNLYPTTHKTIKQIVHVDLYRLQNDAEVKTLALEEFFYDQQNVVIIEWPREAVLSKDKPYVGIKIEGDKQRIISIDI